MVKKVGADRSHPVFVKKCREVLRDLHVRGSIEITTDGEVTGQAIDGKRVSLGNCLWGAKALISYLETHPTPDTW